MQGGIKQNLVDEQETDDTKVTLDKVEIEGTAEEQGCHKPDKIETRELNTAVWVHKSHVHDEQEIKVDQWHEEMDVPPPEWLSVDDHRTVNQRTSENLHCTYSAFENGKPR